MMYEVFLGLGSNLGNKRSNIELAVKEIGKISSHVAVSSLYETGPKGFDGQPAFLNAACRAWTLLDPFELLRTLQGIQSVAGYRSVFTNGPRVLDIDVLTYGLLVMNAPSLIVPHPRMVDREFVMMPLAEIAPEACHPVLGETFGALSNRIPCSGQLRMIEGNLNYLSGVDVR